MIGDRERSITIKAYLEVRKSRDDYFPAELFDEFAWNMLLHLFLAHSENHVLTNDMLFERAAVSQPVGLRWLRHLESSGQIEVHASGNDVHLTAGAIEGMRSYIDLVQAIEKTRY